MATFTQWNRNRKPRQLTWACGPELVLRREVVLEYARSLSVLAARVTLWFGEQPESQIWDYLLASPPDGGRLTVLHDAQLARMPERFELLAQSLPPLSYVLFVSDEDDFTRTASRPGRRQAGEAQLVPHLAAIRASKEGLLLRCCRPSREEELLSLIASWWPGAGSNWAAEVWRRCAGDLTAARQACDIASRAGLAPGIPAHLDMTCQASGAAFSDLVLSGKSAEAVQEARFLGHHEALQAVAMLNADLARVRSYVAWTSRGAAPDEVAKLGLSRYRQHQLAPFAARYTPARELQCRRVLAMAEQALRSGARTGVLEAVASLW